MNRAWLFFVAASAAAQPSPPEAVFRAGTRFVEVDVTLRDQPLRRASPRATSRRSTPPPSYRHRTASAPPIPKMRWEIWETLCRSEEIRPSYRPGYLVTKAASPPPSPTLADLFYDPFEFTSIGLTGQVTPRAEHPGLYDVRVKVDLHDIHLEPKDGQFTGAFDLSIPNPSSKGTAKTVTFSVNLTEAHLAESLDNGGNVTVSGVESDLGKIRVVARDRATGAAGSLLIPVEK